MRCDFDVIELQLHYSVASNTLTRFRAGSDVSYPFTSDTRKLPSLRWWNTADDDDVVSTSQPPVLRRLHVRTTNRWNLIQCRPNRFDGWPTFDVIFHSLLSFRRGPKWLHRFGRKGCLKTTTETTLTTEPLSKVTRKRGCIYLLLWSGNCVRCSESQRTGCCLKLTGRCYVDVHVHHTLSPACCSPTRSHIVDT